MALTWRNVEGPDFGRSLEGIRTFSDLFGGAIGGLDRGLSTFDASMDKTANSKFAMDLLKYQDPAQYKAALASGAVFNGVDPNRINQANIQAAGARTTNLLNQKIGEFGLTRDEYGFARRQTTDANQDAAAPLVAGAIAAGRQGSDAFSKYMAANPALAKLNLADSTALATGALDAESRGVTIDQGRQGISQSGTRFGWEATDRKTQEQADAVLADLSKNGFDATDQISRLNGMKDLDPKVYNAILARLGGGASSGGGGSAAGMISGAVGGGGDPTRIMNYEARAAGFASVPESVKTLGDASDFASNLNSKGVASSAMGVYQIVGQTMRGKNGQNGYAEKALGKDWRNKPFNFENQDKIAEAIFNDYKNNPDGLAKQWTSLSPAKAREIAGKSWAEARQVIAAGESTSDPRALALGGVAAEQGMRNANMARNANNPANTYAKSAGDTRSVAEVAGALGSEPSFKGMNAGYLNEQIRELQSYARKSGKTINAAVAADMLRNSVASTSWGRNMPWWLGGGESAAGRIDGSTAKRYVDEYKQGNIDTAVLANANSAQAAGARQQAEAAYNQAQARLAAAVAAQGRNVKVDTRPLQGDVNRAAAALAAATAAIGNDPGIAQFNGPVRRGPAPVARTSGVKPITARQQQLWQAALARR